VTEKLNVCFQALTHFHHHKAEKTTKLKPTRVENNAFYKITSNLVSATSAVEPQLSLKRLQTISEW